MAEGREQLGPAHIRAGSPPWVALSGHAYIHSLQMQTLFLNQEALLAPLGSVQGTEKGKVKSESEVAQSCLTLCDPMDCSLPDSSVHGIFQASILEWVAIAFSNK